jgi:hypothetical protein
LCTKDLAFEIADVLRDRERAPTSLVAIDSEDNRAEHVLRPRKFE